jgi:hypothetical protein
VLFGAAATTAQQGDQLPEATSDFYPLVPGTRWTYAVGDDRERKVVITVGAAEFVDLKVSEGGKDKTYKVKAYPLIVKNKKGENEQRELVAVLNKDKHQGVHRFAAAGMTFDEPLCFFRLPPAEGTWKVSTMVGGVPVEGTFRCRPDNLQLKGAVWPTFMVTSDDFQIGKHKLKVAYWFAKDHGMVKQMVQTSGGPVVVLQMEKYEPAK